MEGNSGALLTSLAYLANPPEPNEVFGRPSVSGTYAQLEKKDVESFVVTENLWGRVELGYALIRVGLADWPDEVRAATGLRVQDEAFVHNFNARMMVVKEESLDHTWMPAVTLGAHLKWEQDLDDIDEQVGGTVAALGGDHDTGIEFTAIATKTIKGVLPGPLIVSAGLRNGDAIQAGLLGFAGERRTTFEGSVIYLPDRQAPDRGGVPPETGPDAAAHGGGQGSGQAGGRLVGHRAGVHRERPYRPWPADMPTSGTF